MKTFEDFVKRRMGLREDVQQAGQGIDWSVVDQLGKQFPQMLSEIAPIVAKYQQQQQQQQPQPQQQQAPAPTPAAQPQAGPTQGR